MALPAHLAQRDVCTEDEYFAWEQQAFGRWEYVRGEMRAMAGGSDDHNVIALNVGRALGNALAAKGYRVYGSDMKVHAGDGVNTFPDAAVVCGPRDYYKGRTDIITNPLLIVEVLSPSTEGYDRGAKFDHYQTIPSLSDYLLLASDESRAMLYTRAADHWQWREASSLSGSLFLPSVDLTLPLADLYALIDFAPA